jgi:hypothetical protein
MTSEASDSPDSDTVELSVSVVYTYSSPPSMSEPASSVPESTLSTPPFVELSSYDVARNVGAFKISYVPTYTPNQLDILTTHSKHATTLILMTSFLLL